MSRRGMTLIELSVCVIVMALAIAIVSMMLHSIHESFHKTGDALGDVASASRLLDDLKADLRRARTVTLAADRFDLEFEAGIRTAWLVMPTMITREGDGPTREYRVESLAIRRAGRLAIVEIELRRRNPASGYRPRIGSTVILRNAP